MTICISVICEQGSTAILATDSMITNPALSIQFEHPTKKMTHLSGNCIALTAGDALAHTELFNTLEEKIATLKAPSVVEIVDKIKGCYQDIRKSEIKDRILKPWGFDDFGDFYQAQRILNSEVAQAVQNRIDRYDYGLEILVSGIDKRVAHIYAISDPGTSKCYDAIGFHAIGSGLPHAINTLIVRECNESVSIAEGIMIVYEAKKMAEKAPGVGARTDICIMNSKGIIEFPRDKISELHTTYEKWVRKEADWASDLDPLLK